MYFWQDKHMLIDSSNTEHITGGKDNMNVYEIVTEKIIAQLESGVVPWSKPWARN